MDIIMFLMYLKFDINKELYQSTMDPNAICFEIVVLIPVILIILMVDFGKIQTILMFVFDSFSISNISLTI